MLVLRFFLGTIFYYSLFTKVSSAPENNDVFEDNFFLEQDDVCNQGKTMLRVLIEENALHNKSYELFQLKIDHQLDIVIRRRMQIDVDVAVNLLPGRRRLLKEQSAVERRDEMIAILNVYVEENMKGHFRKLQDFSRKDVSLSYLDALNIDIIDNTLLPNDMLFEFAKKLPCLKYPPEKDLKRYPSDFEHSYIIPNDPFADPFLEDAQNFFHGIDSELNKFNITGINLYEAWRYHTGEDSNFIVGVVDSGCTLNSDILKNLCRGNICKSVDFGTFNGDPFVEPLNDVHGLSMAGVIASTTNNGNMLAGICWGCKIMCLKVYSPKANALLSSCAIAAMNYMLKKKIKLSNHSYNGYGSSYAEFSAISKLRDAGHIIVAAAGNKNCNVDARWPSDKDGCHIDGVRLKWNVPISYTLDNIVGVGSTDNAGNLAKFSNYGKDSVDVFAPGKDILVLFDPAIYKRGIVYMTGTSVSTAIVTGVLALMWSSIPDADMYTIKDILFATARRIESLADKSTTGAIIDAGAAMHFISQNFNMTSFKRLPSESMSYNGVVYNGLTNLVQSTCALGFAFLVLQMLFCT